MAFGSRMVTLLFFVTVWCAALCAEVTIDANVVNKEVQRKIDLTSALVKVKSDITIENTGKSSISSYIYAVEEMFSNALSSVTAASASKDENGDALASKRVNVKGISTGSFYEIALHKPLSAGASTTITVVASFSHILVPFPAEIKQAEKQLVKFSGNLYFYTPYKTTLQKTVVLLASPSVESYTKTKPSTKSDSTITYGPFENIATFDLSDLQIHYENNNPFLAVTSMTRVIEVSHWGNIAVEETYHLRHTGAKLKGSFSRYDYQRQSAHSSVKSFKTVLPASAADVYYRDEIGNISTSNMREMDDAVELELRPRFPLFGGWKTHYVVGYNIPSYQYLWTNGGSSFALKMPFVDHIFDSQVVDEITVKIILPEGANVENIKVPYEYQRGTDQLQYTYLDTVGRPVIVMSKKNLVDDHIQDFTLSYSFNKMSLLREPMMVVGFFYFIFLFVIVYVRLDFSISRDEAAESKLKVASYIENAQTVLDRRSALYQAYDDAVNKYKASKDMSAYQAQRKKVDADHKELTSQVTTLQNQLKLENADAAAEKLAEMQKLDVAYKESVSASFQSAEKLVGNPLSRDAYLNKEEQAANKRAELLNKMETIANQL